MDEVPDDMEVSVFISPDGYEMVIPVFNKKMTGVKAFIGMDTATAYDNAKLRTGRDFGSYRMQLQMSNWPKIVRWFAIHQDQGERLLGVSSNWMLGIADRVRSLGYDSETVIDLDTVNMAIADDME
jgi:hypothetical protein